MNFLYEMRIYGAFAFSPILTCAQAYESGIVKKPQGLAQVPRLPPSISVLFFFFLCILLVNFQGCLRCQLESSEMRSDSFEPGWEEEPERQLWCAWVDSHRPISSATVIMAGLFSAACVDFGTEGAGLELYPIGRSKMDKIPKSYDRGLLYPQLICQLQ